MRWNHDFITNLLIVRHIRSRLISETKVFMQTFYINFQYLPIFSENKGFSEIQTVKITVLNEKSGLFLFEKHISPEEVDSTCYLVYLSSVLVRGTSQRFKFCFFKVTRLPGCSQTTFEICKHPTKPDSLSNGEPSLQTEYLSLQTGISYQTELFPFVVVK